MSNSKKHIDNLNADKQSAVFFSAGDFKWEKSEAQLWDELERKMENKPAGKSISLKNTFVRMAVAASVIVLLGLAGLTFYSKTELSPLGEHRLVELPDGSKIKMNAESTVKYYPYRWYVSRKVEFEGEGYFDVQKGKQFDVVSEKGTTSVLGTSFNIYSRDEEYKVTCLTGVVKVALNSEKSVILEPKQHAIIDKNGEIRKISNFNTDQVVSWRYNRFLFTSTPVVDVLKEIERQYNVSINFNVDTSRLNYALIYTGNFNKEQNVEDVLKLVCKPLDIKFVKRSKKEYVVQSN